MSHTTQVSLLHRLRSRQDSNAWSKFIQLYTPLIHKWVADLGITDPLRSDVAQEVFVVLLRKLASFKYSSNGSFRGWLRTITINKSRDALRKKNRLTEPKFTDKIEIANTSDAELLTQREYRDYLANAAIQLMQTHFSKTTWQACWESVARNRPAKEVADELGISINAVYLARGRVLQRLRQELAGLWE